MKGLFYPVIILFLGCAALSAQTPVIFDGGILNGASFDKTLLTVSPGELVSIFGTNLAAASATADSIPLSTQLSGVEVLFGNFSAPMVAVAKDSGQGYDQVNLQVPFEVLPPGTATGSVQVVVRRNGVPSAPQTIQLGQATPGVFTWQGTTRAVAYGNSDLAAAAPVGAGLPITSHPAKIGDQQTLLIYATGLGPVTPAVKTGHAALEDGVLHNTANPVTVLVGNVAADVKFAGMSPQFVGVYQLNVVLSPGTPVGDNIALQVRVNGVTSPNTITIATSN